MSDFLPAEETTFKRGKAKPQELKPWQAMHNGKPIPKVRCWDDPLGCEEWKLKGEFRWHPHLCDSCTLALANDYQVPIRDVDILVLLIHQDNSLQKSAKVMGGNADKLAALYKGRQSHLSQLHRAMMEGWFQKDKVPAVNKTYRLWFYDQAGVDPVKSRKPAPGFAEMEPVR